MKPIHNLLQHIGRRGAFLLFLSTIFLTGGYNFFDRSAQDLQRLYPLLKYVPVEAWGVAWMTVGALCVLGSILGAIEWVAFGLSSFLMLSWSANYIWAWTNHTVPRPWTGLVIYSSFALMITLISGWREHNGSRPLKNWNSK